MTILPIALVAIELEHVIILIVHKVLVWNVLSPLQWVYSVTEAHPTLMMTFVKVHPTLADVFYGLQ